MAKNDRRRRSYSVDQKAAILRSHFVDKLPVADVCEHNDLQPSVYYGWQKQVLENLELVLAQRGRQRPDPTVERLERENKALRAKLAAKDEVIAEVASEMVRLRKRDGEP